MTNTQVGAAGRLLREMLGTIGTGRDTEGAGPSSGAALRAVQRARPARSVAAEVAAAGGADAGTGALLRESTEHHLGADTARWCGLHDALTGYRGSLPELLATLVVSPASAVSDDTVRPPAPRSVHRTLGLLLEHAEPRHAAAALAALPERVTTELLAGGPLPAPALVAAHAVTPFMPKACEELARHEAANEAQRHAFRLSVLNEPWRAGRRAGNTTPPARRLAAEHLDGSAAVWAEGMTAAGLLDPVDLIGTARPAAHALAALARLADRELLGTAAVAELHALTGAHLRERERAWAAFDALLPEHGGTVAELIAEAGKPEGVDVAVAEPGPSAEPEPVPPTADPLVGRTGRTLHRGERALALAALDALHSLAPDGAPPAERPRGAARADGVRPGDRARPRHPALGCCRLRRPWVSASEDGVAYEAPSPAQVRARLPETYGSGAQYTERAYVQGVLPADELLTLLPARRLLLLPHDWRRLAFADAWRTALARRLRADLGTDPDAWLRLAATATEGLTWAELLERAQSGAGPATSEGTPIGRPRPTTPDEAIQLLERGDHLWGWPEGTLLCLADPGVIDAVLPRLGPDGPWLLAAYLLRHDRTPLAVLDRLLADRDHHALRVLAAQSRWMKRSGAVRRLVDLDDPEVDLAVLRHGAPQSAVHRIVTRSRPGAERPSLGARVLADWRAGGSAWPAGGLTWLCSAEPDVVEELLENSGSRLGLGHQLIGCLRLFEHGGADRLARLAGRDALGRSATTVCAKAPASADPAAVLRARLDREPAPEKLVRKLRRARNAPHARDLVGSLPPGEPVDWTALEAAHAQEPLPYWPDLVRLDGVPEDVRMRHAALLPEPGPDAACPAARGSPGSGPGTVSAACSTARRPPSWTGCSGRGSSTARTWSASRPRPRGCSPTWAPPPAARTPRPRPPRPAPSSPTSYAPDSAPTRWPGTGSPSG